MREKFVVIGIKRFGEAPEALREVYLIEESAIGVAIKIFNKTGMYKVALVNGAMSVVFKDTRKCKCTNVQQEVVEWKGEPCYRNRCMDCGQVIDYNAWLEGLGVEERMEEVMG